MKHAGIEAKPTIDEQLRRLAEMRDEDIDFSDIPERTDWSGAVRRRDFPDFASMVAELRRRAAAKAGKE